MARHSDKISYVGLDHIAARLSVTKAVVRGLKEYVELKDGKILIGRKWRWTQEFADQWVANFARQKCQAEAAQAATERLQEVSQRARQAVRTQRRAALAQQKVVPLAEYSATRQPAA